MAPLALNFLNASTGSITSYAWTFGDGGTSTVANPTHVYAAPGIYSVSLKVTGPAGSNTQTRTNYVTVTTAVPVAQFTGNPTSGGSPLTVAFTNTSTGSITSYAWTFGDGGTSTAASPSHVYAAAGVYSVSLKVTGPAGSNTQTRTNYVTVNSAGTSTTVVLQRGLNGYAGATDTYLDNLARTTARGAGHYAVAAFGQLHPASPLRDLPVGGWTRAQRGDDPVGQARGLQTVL
jgi:PKD repeat protein